MKTLHHSIINFAYFTANFHHDFIEKCWNDNELLRKHLRSKFNSYDKETGFISVGDFMKFFFDLDRTNQERLVLWINDNYDYKS